MKFEWFKPAYRPKDDSGENLKANGVCVGGYNLWPHICDDTPYEIRSYLPGDKPESGKRRFKTPEQARVGLEQFVTEWFEVFK